ASPRGFSRVARSGVGPEHTIRALLVGIDHYPGDEAIVAGQRIRCSDLHGCVRDVERVEMFLRERMGVSPAHIRKLTARHGVSSDEVKPTYQNLVGMLRSL